MWQYVWFLEDLGMEVLEASKSQLTEFWFLKARDEDGVEYAWAVDPCKGPIEDGGEVPFEAYLAWDLLETSTPEEWV